MLGFEFFVGLDADLFCLWACSFVFALFLIFTSSFYIFTFSFSNFSFLLFNFSPMRFFSYFFLGVFYLILSSIPVFAQSYQVELSGPEIVTNGEIVIAVLEVKDQDGNPAKGMDPEITFNPGENVKEEMLFDCGDEEVFDNCQANHQGVPGIFEISFLLVDQPVLLEATAGGIRRGIRLGTVFSSENALYEKKYAKSPSVDKTKPLAPEVIQAGPWPSYWILILPFLLLVFVLKLFVNYSPKE